MKERIFFQRYLLCWSLVGDRILLSPCKLAYPHWLGVVYNLFLVTTLRDAASPVFMEFHTPTHKAMASVNISHGFLKITNISQIFDDLIVKLNFVKINLLQ